MINLNGFEVILKYINIVILNSNFDFDFDFGISEVIKFKVLISLNILLQCTQFGICQYHWRF